LNITVYLGSFEGKSDVYKKTAKELGNYIGKKGHNLIYGGSAIGLMGFLADGVLEKGGKVYGFEPRFFVNGEMQHKGVTKLTITETMAERKSLLIEKGDVFIAFPGGLGTLEEITEVMTLNKIGQINKPFYFLNIENYYEPLKKLFGHMVDNGFLEEDFYNSLKFLNSVEELAKELEERP